MNKLSFAFDPSEISNSTINVFKYLAPTEVRSFCEDCCKGDHIFIDLVIMLLAFEARTGTDIHNIYDLTSSLLKTFDENKAEDLIDLIDKISKLSIDEIIEMF